MVITAALYADSDPYPPLRICYVAGRWRVRLATAIVFIAYHGRRISVAKLISLNSKPFYF